MGSELTNKYAEGYPGKRYYGGCKFVDVVERLAIDRLTKLYGARFANVQPHSGAQANMAVYYSLLQPSDTIMGMNLSLGGHLTHGSPVSISGKWFKMAHYGVRKDTPQLIDFCKLKEITGKVGARLMIDMAHIAGLVAVGLHPSPIPCADVVTSTTYKTLRPRGGIILTNDEELHKGCNKGIFPGIQGGPLMHVIAAKAVTFKEALQPCFKEYTTQIVKNAGKLVETIKKEGAPRFRRNG